MWMAMGVSPKRSSTNCWAVLQSLTALISTMHAFCWTYDEMEWRRTPCRTTSTLCGTYDIERTPFKGLEYSFRRRSRTPPSPLCSHFVTRCAAWDHPGNVWIYCILRSCVTMNEFYLYDVFLPQPRYNIRALVLYIAKLGWSDDLSLQWCWSTMFRTVKGCELMVHTPHSKFAADESESYSQSTVRNASRKDPSFCPATAVYFYSKQICNG